MATANGSPTKEFFVDMLTRDIDLNDAILDLLDNCLDGVVRVLGKKRSRDDVEYYKGFKAEITISGTQFILRDNCGGIPRDVAEEKAFRMGRPKDETNEDLPTVGIYGIGMKRAIFKIGSEGEVITKNSSKAYSVKIPKNWVESDVWEFQIEDLDSVPEFIDSGGTSIEIQTLHPAIASRLNSEDSIKNFIQNLNRAIQSSYSLIIEKGFEICVNGTPITANPTQLLISEKGIKPFVYERQYDDVSVKLIIGFYAPILSDDEIDEINDFRRTTADAGWTIICNDRVVLYNDKTHLTGWGEAGVPNYHTQFIGIRGIVFFQSNNPKNLPMTTTKRGVDLASPIYADVKEHMREGLKMFTSYTNRWKGRFEQEKQYSSVAISMPIQELLNDTAVKNQYNLITTQKRDGAFEYKPTLPAPTIDRNYLVIRYSKSKDDIQLLANKLFGDDLPEVRPSEIGEKCFDLILETHRPK